MHNPMRAANRRYYMIVSRIDFHGHAGTELMRAATKWLRVGPYVSGQRGPALAVAGWRWPVRTHPELQPCSVAVEVPRSAVPALVARTMLPASVLFYLHVSRACVRARHRHRNWALDLTLYANSTSNTSTNAGANAGANAGTNTGTNASTNASTTASTSTNDSTNGSINDRTNNSTNHSTNTGTNTGTNDSAWTEHSTGGASEHNR